MDYVVPAAVVSDAVNAAVKKSTLSVGDMLIRGALSGAFLGCSRPSSTRFRWNSGGGGIRYL